MPQPGFQSDGRSAQCYQHYWILLKHTALHKLHSFIILPLQSSKDSYRWSQDRYERDKGIKLIKHSFPEVDPIFLSSQPENMQQLGKKCKKKTHINGSTSLEKIEEVTGNNLNIDEIINLAVNGKLISHYSQNGLGSYINSCICAVIILCKGQVTIFIALHWGGWWKSHRHHMKGMHCEICLFDM